MVTILMSLIVVYGDSDCILREQNHMTVTVFKGDTSPVKLLGDISHDCNCISM